MAEDVQPDRLPVLFAASREAMAAKAWDRRRPGGVIRED
jgi:hypothetical protein